MFVLAATGLFIGFQWKEMRSGSADTHELAVQAKNQSDAARSLADAAKSQSSNTEKLAQAAGDQVKQLEAEVKESRALVKASQDAVALNRDALISVQRAYVTFSQTMEQNAVDDEADPQRIRVWEFRPRLENSGTTPTRQARGRANTLSTRDPLPVNYRFPDLSTQSSPTTPFVIGPKGSITEPVLAVPPDVLEGVRNHALRLYFWGWTTYRDVFPNTPLHISMFCVEMVELRGADTRRFPASPVAMSWTQCEGLHHNCSDADCNGEPYGTPTKVWPN